MGGGPASQTSTSGRRRVAVLGGGGVGGLATLKVFLDRHELQGPNPQWDILAYEARRDVGGVWLAEYPGEHTKFPGRAPVPPTPRYDSLITNTPHPLMGLHDFPFPPETPLFPPASVVQTYLSAYADHFKLRRHIRFNTTVDDLRWDKRTSQWVVRVTEAQDATRSLRQREERFDAVVIANGHYHLPNFPKIKGIDSWSAFGRKSMHSIWFRTPSPFRNLVVLIVGGGPSGSDATKDIGPVAKTVYHAMSDDEALHPEMPGNSNVHRRRRLVELRGSTGQAFYSDGVIDDDIDIVIFATGYETVVPFFEHLQEVREYPSSSLPNQLFRTKFSVLPLARHTFPLRDYPPRTLAFVGLAAHLAPFPGMDTQAQAVATVFLSDDRIWDQEREELLFIKRFHALKERCGGDIQKVAKDWHKMGNGDVVESWEVYRTALLEMAGRDAPVGWQVQDWERHFTSTGISMRAEWVRLEQEGLAQEWLKGVGHGGIQDWIKLMDRVLDHAQQRLGGDI